MNEIRMYVERLFQGRTLTDDVIELKEEIYGNLVARYEDYLATGMPEAEALEKTKASMTSVDDVLAGASSAAGDSAEGAASADAMEAATAMTESAAKTVPANPVVAKSSSTPASSGPVLSFNRKWIIALVAVAVVLALGGIGFKIVDEMNDAHEDRQEEQRERQQDANAADARGDAGGATDVDRGAVSTQSKGDEITVGSDGTIRMDGEAADDLLAEVVDAGYAALHPYIDIDLSDGKAVEQAVRALPMSAWATDVDVTKGEGTLSFAYRNVPDYDGDSIDAALTYNATALLCMIPDLREVQITVAEADDPADEDYYVFQRSVLEKAYGVALNGDIVSESGWRQLKEDNLYKKDFIDRAIDHAERDWR